MKRLVSFFIMASLLLALAACGFHLRGVNEDKIKIKELSVSVADRYGELAKDLRERLEMQGVKINDTAMYHLAVSSSTESRTLAYSSSIRGTDIGLVLTLKYQIYGAQKLLLISDQVEARGSYVSDINNVIADELQRDAVDRELRQNVITLLIYRLRAISTTELEDLQHKAEEKLRLENEAKKQRQKITEERRKLLMQSIPLDELEQLNSQ